MNEDRDRDRDRVPGTAHPLLDPPSGSYQMSL